MKVLGNWSIFYLWPFQKPLHFGIPHLSGVPGNGGT